MRNFGLAIRRLYHRGLALAILAVVTLSTGALAQIDSSTTSSQSSSSTTTTTTTTEFISDWRFWALLGAVLLVIIVIAATRGRGDRTTVVK